MEPGKQMSVEEWQKIKKGLARLSSWGLFVSIAMILFKGWVLSVMWNWFIPSTFTSVPHLSIGEAIGLSLVASAIIDLRPRNEGKEGEIRIYLFADAFALFTKSIGLLFVGLMIHLLMS